MNQLNGVKNPTCVKKFGNPAEITLSVHDGHGPMNVRVTYCKVTRRIESATFLLGGRENPVDPVMMTTITMALHQKLYQQSVEAGKRRFCKLYGNS